MQRYVSPASGKKGKRRARVAIEELVEAPDDPVVVRLSVSSGDRRGQHAREVITPRAGAHEQDKPCRLQIVYRRQFVEQALLRSPFVLQEGLLVSRVAGLLARPTP